MRIITSQILLSNCIKSAIFQEGSISENVISLRLGRRNGKCPSATLDILFKAKISIPVWNQKDIPRRKQTKTNN